MRKKLPLLSTLLTGLTMVSCSLLTPDTTQFTANDLIGLWQENGTQVYMRFTTEHDSAMQYQYGREWDEGDDVFEEDLKPYGNGWFKWKLVTTSLTQIHLMDNGGAQVPKVYTVSKLTTSELSYKDDMKLSHSFTKVVTKE